MATGSIFYSRPVMLCRWLLWRRSRAMAVMVALALLTAVMVLTTSHPKQAAPLDDRISTARLYSQNLKKNGPATRIVQHVEYVVPDHCPPLSPSPTEDPMETDISDFPLGETGLQAQDAFVWQEEERLGRRPDVILQPAGLCSSKSPRLLVLVPSFPTHGGLRHLIRRTWGSVRSTENGDVRVVFLIGQSFYTAINEAMERESRHHGDILLMDFMDSYWNLTLKVLGGLSWTTQRCNAEFILKADDDTFINLSALLRMLTGKPRPEHALWGRFYLHESGVARTGRWAVDPDLYPLKSYPPYASGVAYVVTGLLGACLVDQWRHTDSFPVEDVYISSVLLPRCAASRYHVTSLVTWDQETPDACDLARGIKMAAHHVAPRLAEELWRLHQEFLKTQKTTTLGSTLKGAKAKFKGVAEEERDSYVDGVLNSLKDSADNVKYS